MSCVFWNLSCIVLMYSGNLCASSVSIADRTMHWLSILRRPSIEIGLDFCRRSTSHVPTSSASAIAKLPPLPVHGGTTWRESPMQIRGRSFCLNVGACSCKRIGLTAAKSSASMTLEYAGSQPSPMSVRKYSRIFCKDSPWCQEEFACTSMASCS